jgi:hypothetical protein
MIEMLRNKVVIDKNIWLYVVAGVPSAVRYMNRTIHEPASREGRY